MREYDVNGNPMLVIKSKAMYVGKGKIENKVNPDVTRTTPFPLYDVNVGFQNKDYKFSPWGDLNNYPDIIYNNYISKSTVLRSAINFRKQVTAGQGLFAVNLTDIGPNGNEILELSSDKEAKLFVRSRNARRYWINFFHQIYSYGIAFVEIVLNEPGTKIISLNIQRAGDCRLTEMKNGVIEYCLLNGDWFLRPLQPDALVPVLDSYDPLYDLKSRKGKERKFILPIRLDDECHYYGTPSFESARQAGWLDVAISVPDYLKNMFQNQMSLKYLVRIPYSYWDKKYPKGIYKDNVTRQELIDAELDAFEDELTGTESAMKTFITHFEVNQQGKAEEKWDIEVIEDKFKNDMYLPHSAAANSEILFSMGVNPSVLGAGLPGGPYAGNSGSGSDIREALLVNVALSWADRELGLDPLYLMRDFNGWNPETEFRTINTILTTLDTGAGTGKTLG